MHSYNILHWSSHVFGFHSDTIASSLMSSINEDNWNQICQQVVIGNYKAQKNLIGNPRNTVLALRTDPIERITKAHN